MKKLLENNIELYRQLIDNANVIINAFDGDGNILIWNKAAQEITGYSQKEALANKAIMELMYPDVEYRKEVLKSIGGAFKEDYKNVEYTMTTKYGDKKCISWSAIVIKNKKGEVAGSFAIGIDVTLKNIVKRRERESFRALLKSVRYSDDIKQRSEELIAELKSEVNALLSELSRPAKY
jgi:PAS domain S-box-containing protein